MPPAVQPNANALGQATDGVFTVIGDGLPVEVSVGGSVTLDVSFAPSTAKVCNANLRLTTFDNQYDNQFIEVAGEDRRLVFQAVHMILEGDLQKPWGEKERRWSRAVFIGRDLDEAALRAGFEACAA